MLWERTCRITSILFIVYHSNDICCIRKIMYIQARKRERQVLGLGLGTGVGGAGYRVRRSKPIPSLGSDVTEYSIHDVRVRRGISWLA